MEIRQVYFFRRVAQFLGLPFLAFWGYTVWQAYPDNGGVEAGFAICGRFALTFLILTLSITPISRLFKAPMLIKLRRPLGLWSLAWAITHAGTFIIYKINFQVWLLPAIDQKYPFIIFGQAALLILLCLALTSNRWSMSRLGHKWRSLHRLVYVALILACTHFLLSSGTPRVLAIVYAILGAVLLLVRLLPASKSASLPKA